MNPDERIEFFNAMPHEINKWNDGIIYGIKVPHAADYLYIGSTTSPVNLRFSQHKSRANGAMRHRRPIHHFIAGIGVDNVEIHVIEPYPCESKDELLTREDYFIEMYRPQCNPIFARRNIARTFYCASCDKHVRRVNKKGHEESRKHVARKMLLDMIAAYVAARHGPALI